MKRLFKKYIILYNLRSVENTASIFRTADALGVDAIYLIGTTPTPLDRFNRPRNDFAKVSLGAEKSVRWEKKASLPAFIKELKKKKVEIVSVEQDKSSIDYKKFKPAGTTALIFGNEVDGIPKSILKKSDRVVEMQMRGKKESLNVAVSFGVVGFRLFDKN